MLARGDDELCSSFYRSANKHIRGVGGEPPASSRADLRRYMPGYTAPQSLNARRAWHVNSATLRRENDRLKAENKNIERDFDRLYQRAYIAEVQLNNLKAAASKTPLGGANYSVTQLVKLAANLLELLTKQPEQTCVSVIPDALACLSMCHVRDRRLFAAGEKLKRTLQCPGGASGYNGKESKTHPIGRPAGEVAPDLKWLATVSDDLSWLKWADQWDVLPMDLRWISIAVDDRSLLLHRFLWARAPVDLRYLTVVSGNMDWLYIGPDRWYSTPIQLRLRAIALEDPTIIKPTMAEAALYGLEREKIANTLIPDADLPNLPSPHAPEEDLDLTLRISLSPADIAVCENNGGIASSAKAGAPAGTSGMPTPGSKAGQPKETSASSKVGMAKTVPSPLSKTAPPSKADASEPVPSKVGGGSVGGPKATPSPSKAGPPPKDSDKPGGVAKKASPTPPSKAEGVAASGSGNAPQEPKSVKGASPGKKGPGPLGVKGGSPLPPPGGAKGKASPESATAKGPEELPKGPAGASKTAVPGKAAPVGPGKGPAAPLGKKASGEPVGKPKAEMMKSSPSVGEPKADAKKSPPPPSGSPKAESKKSPSLPLGEPKADVKKSPPPPLGEPKADVKKSPPPPLGGPKAEMKKSPPGASPAAPKADSSPPAAPTGATPPKTKLGAPPGKAPTAGTAEGKEAAPAKKGPLPAKGAAPLGKKGPPPVAKAEDTTKLPPPTAGQNAEAEGAGVSAKKQSPLGKGPPPKKGPLQGKKAPPAPDAPDAKADDASPAKKGPPKGLPKGKAPPKGKGFL